MTRILARPEHEVVYQDLIDLMSKRAGEVSAVEMLAIAANAVGKLIALQDRRRVTPEMAMEIVVKNIEVGNAHSIAHLSTPAGHA